MTELLPKADATSWFTKQLADEKCTEDHLLQLLASGNIEIHKAVVGEPSTGGVVSLLALAIVYKRARVVRQLIIMGSSVNLRVKPAGWNDVIAPLHIAVERGLLDVADFLLSAGASQEEGSSLRADTPLMIACRKRDTAMARLLLSHPAIGSNAPHIANARNLRGDTPLTFACTCFCRAYPKEDERAIAPIQKPISAELIATLLEFGADANLADSAGRTPLIQALRCRCVDTNHTNGTKDTPHAEEYRLSIDTATQASAIHHQASEIITTAVRMLVEHGAAPSAVDSSGKTALMRAARHGHFQSIQLLVQQYSALLYDAEQRPTSAMSVRLPRTSSFDRPRIVLDFALQGGYYDIASFIIQAMDSAPPPAPPAMDSIVSRGDEFVKLIVSHSVVDPASWRRRGDQWMLLHIYSYHGNSEMVQYLLAQMKASGLTRCTLDAGSEGEYCLPNVVNARDIEGRTPLHLAALASSSSPTKYIEIIRILMEHGGAIVGVKDHHNKTPIEVATCAEAEFALKSLGKVYDLCIVTAEEDIDIALHVRDGLGYNGIVCGLATIGTAPTQDHFDLLSSARAALFVVGRTRVSAQLVDHANARCMPLFSTIIERTICVDALSSEMLHFDEVTPQNPPVFCHLLVPFTDHVRQGGAVFTVSQLQAIFEPLAETITAAVRVSSWVKEVPLDPSQLMPMPEEDSEEAATKEVDKLSATIAAQRVLPTVVVHETDQSDATPPSGLPADSSVAITGSDEASIQRRNSTTSGSTSLGTSSGGGAEALERPESPSPASPRMKSAISAPAQMCTPSRDSKTSLKKPRHPAPRSISWDDRLQSRERHTTVQPSTSPKKQHYLSASPVAPVTETNEQLRQLLENERKEVERLREHIRRLEQRVAALTKRNAELESCLRGQAEDTSVCSPMATPISYTTPSSPTKKNSAKLLSSIPPGTPQTSSPVLSGASPVPSKHVALPTLFPQPHVPTSKQAFKATFNAKFMRHRATYAAELRS